MKNVVKSIAEKFTDNAFTVFYHYQPKMPNSLMAKVEGKNKKD